MRKFLIGLTFWCLSLTASSQTGTDFWIAPPDVSDLHNAPGGEPIYLLIGSQANTITTVTISMPAQGSFIPIVVNVNPGKTYRVNLTAFKSSLETRPTNTITNTGLRIQSTAPVSVTYEIANTNNTDFTSLKGANALGNYFYIPFHKHAPFLNHGFAAPHQAFASFDIVATQNNTIVTIYSPLPVDGHPALQQFSITLNAGQAYSCAYTGVNYDQSHTHPSGAVILSDKPVAVSLKDDSQHNPSGGCYDLQFEQIVPVSNLGTDHIAIKGSLNNNGDESVVILATVNGTNIYLNGAATPVITMFAGEYYRVDMDYLSSSSDNSVFIHASQPVYAMHFTGFGCEMADALLPPVTYGTTSVNIARTSSETFYVNLVVRTANVNSFIVTGPGTATINPASFVAVPGTGGQYSAARIQYNTTQFPVDSTFAIHNTTGSFQAAILNGGGSSGARYTYFSPFGASGSLPLRLLRLSGRTEANGNYLEWIAGEDGERYRYDLQMQQGADWVTIESAESGTVSGNKSYNFIHSLQNGGARAYRIAATELSINKTIYSNTITLNRGNAGRGTMSVYPNPSSDEINIQLSEADGSVTAKVYTVSGQLVQQKSGTGNTFTIDIRNLQAGIYVLRVEDGSNQWMQRVTKL